MAAPRVFSTKCPSCGAGLPVPPGVPQVVCRYCQNVIQVEHRKPPPNVQPFGAGRVVYIDPAAMASAQKASGLMIAMIIGFSVLLPLIIGFGAFAKRALKSKVKPFPVACGLNEDVEVSGTFETTGPIVTSAAHNCKLHIKDAKLKGSSLVKTSNFNMELTLENVTIETTDTMIHAGSNLKVKVTNSTLTSASTVIDGDVNTELDLEGGTIESKNGIAIKTDPNLKIRMEGGKIRGKKGGVETESGFDLSMKKASEITSSEGPATKAASSFKVEADGGKIEGAGGAIVASSSLTIAGTGLTLKSTGEKAIAASSSLKLDLTDSSITSLTQAAIEGDSSVELNLANVAVQGVEAAVMTKSNAKIKATKKTRFVAPTGYGILTSSNTELTLSDAAIEAGAKAFKGTVNNKVKLLQGARLAGKKGGIEVEGNVEIDATGATIDGGAGPGLMAGYNARIELRQGLLKGTPAIQTDRKPITLDIGGTRIEGEQKIPGR